MTTISKEQLIAKIRQGNYKVARIFDRGFQTIPHNTPYFEYHELDSPDDLIAAMETFFKSYFGIYTILLKRSRGSAPSGDCLVRVNNVPEQSQALNGTVVGGQNYETAEQMKKRILAELHTDFTIKSLQAQNSMYLAQIGETSTSSGRLALMIENFIIAKMGGKAPMFQNGAKLDGNVEIENKQETEISDADFKKAVVKVVDMFGAETIVNISKNYEKGDPMVEMLIKTVNNGQ